MSSELKRLVRICRYKDWDLNFHYEECAQTRMKQILSGDLVVTDLRTGSIVVTAHDVNEGQKQVVRTCCQKLLCRIEVRRAEKELKEKLKQQKYRNKLKAMEYLDAAFEASPNTKKNTKETINSQSDLDNVGVEESKESDLSSDAADNRCDETSESSVVSSITSSSAEEDLASTIESEFKKFTPFMKRHLEKILSDSTVLQMVS